MILYHLKNYSVESVYYTIILQAGSSKEWVGGVGLPHNNPPGWIIWRMVWLRWFTIQWSFRLDHLKNGLVEMVYYTMILQAGSSEEWFCWVGLLHNNPQGWIIWRIVRLSWFTIQWSFRLDHLKNGLVEMVYYTIILKAGSSEEWFGGDGLLHNDPQGWIIWRMGWWSWFTTQ